MTGDNMLNARLRGAPKTPYKVIFKLSYPDTLPLTKNYNALGLLDLNT